MIKYCFSKIADAIKQKKLAPLNLIEIRLDRLSMSPHHYWIANGKGMEKPFTGEYYDKDEKGSYHCFHCFNKLFTSDSKYNAQTGYASFFQHFQKSVKISNQLTKYITQIQCNKCKSHIGQISQDGPPPTFFRYSINSSALKFKKEKQNKII